MDEKQLNNTDPERSWDTENWERDSSDADRHDDREGAVQCNAAMTMGGVAVICNSQVNCKTDRPDS